MHPPTSLRPLIFALATLAAAASTAGCSGSSSSPDPQEQLDCDAGPVIRTTADGVEFVRTPTGCFEDLPNFNYALESVDIDGLRQGYIDEGPADAPVVLHGKASCSSRNRS